MDNVLKSLDLNFFGNAKHKITPELFLALDAAVLLDLRTQEEVDTITFGLKHHRNIQVIHIPLDELPDRLPELPTDRPIGLFCSSGVRAGVAYGFLMAHGFTQVRILEGGYVPFVEALKPGVVLKAVQKEGAGRM
jgi:rhodanese-related sulfurtransferase